MWALGCGYGIFLLSGIGSGGVLCLFGRGLRRDRRGEERDSGGVWCLRPCRRKRSGFGVRVGKIYRFWVVCMGDFFYLWVLGAVLFEGRKTGKLRVSAGCDRVYGKRAVSALGFVRSLGSRS